MSNTPWFRFYNETINDLKIQRTADMADQQKALVVGVWAAVLAMASDSPDRGRLLISDDMPVTLREILRYAGIDTEPGKAIIAAMLEVGILSLDGDTYVVTSWDSRQFASDSSKERVRQYRERLKHKEVENEAESNDDSPHNHHNGAVTEDRPAGYVKRDGNVTVTAQESDTDTDKDSETDIETTTTTAPACERSDNPVDLRIDNTNPEFGKIISLYESNGFFISPIMGQSIGDTYDGLTPPTGETRLEWYEYSFREAFGTDDKPRPRLIDTIVLEIQHSGSLARHKKTRSKQKSESKVIHVPRDLRQNPNGHTDPAARLTPDQIALNEQITARKAAKKAARQQQHVS